MSDKESIRHYDNIRELLGHLQGQRLIEITAEDQEDRDAGRDGYVELMFENGNTVKFFLVDGDDYKCGFPLCFSDPDPDAPEDDGFYHPDSADAAAHKWAAVEHYNEEGPATHIIPCFGKLHFIEKTCWCGPKREVTDNDVLMFNHNEVAE